MKKKEEIKDAEITKKESLSLFDLILIPSGILIAYTVLISSIQSWIYSLSEQFQIGISILGIFLQISIFAYIGFKLTESKIQKSSLSFFAGFVSGAIVSFVGAIIGILSLYFFPSNYSYAIDLILQQGVTEEVALTSLQFAAGINLVLGPIITGLIGGIISWISFLIFKKRN